jgi:protein-tyrosine-phosphatase
VIHHSPPQESQAWLIRNPWAVSLGSAGFVLAMLWIAASVDWDLGATIGGGSRHAPLWLLLLLGGPLFGAGVVVGIVRQIRMMTGHTLRASTEEPEDGFRRLIVVSPHGAGRAPIAVAYFRRLLPEDVEVTARALDPALRVDPEAVAAMHLDHVDLDPDAVPVRLQPQDLVDADLVVRIGCRDTCPVPRGTQVQDWFVEAADGGVVAWSAVRDAIHGRVDRLAQQLGVATPASRPSDVP